MITLVETSRLIVKAPTMNDLDNYIKLHMDPDVRRLMYTRAKDEAEVKKWLEASIRHQERFGFTVGSVYEKATNEFIGRAGLLHLGNEFENPEVEIDCYLLKPFWRQKYGTELLHAFFQLGFSQFTLEKIIAIVYPINTVAKALAEHAGMQLTGIKSYHGIDFLWYVIYQNKPAI